MCIFSVQMHLKPDTMLFEEKLTVPEVSWILTLRLALLWDAVLFNIYRQCNF